MEVAIFTGFDCTLGSEKGALNWEIPRYRDPKPPHKPSTQVLPVQVVTFFAAACHRTQYLGSSFLGVPLGKGIQFYSILLGHAYFGKYPYDNFIK